MTPSAMYEFVPRREISFLSNFTRGEEGRGEDDYQIETSHFQFQMIWIISWLSILEYGVLWYQRKPLPAYHENLLSLAHAIFNSIIKLSIRTVEFTGYLWLWKNYSVWSCHYSNSVLSFLAVIMVIDFAFYWFHRASHEIMLFWAIHQVHHSSADYTILVSLRHSPLQNLFSWVFYFPFALLGLPPSHLMFHLQINFLLQTWLHTCTINRLGVLEWILNTPSHHRVHHGVNAKCLDKNYGGILIIWDIIFGTFRKENPQEEIIYGIVYQPDFWNVFYHQVFYLQQMVGKAKTMTNWKNFIETFFKGPSWYPGLSWTGREGDALDFDEKLRKGRVKANSSTAVNCYVCAHLVAALVLLTYISEGTNTMAIALPAYHLLILSVLLNVGIIYEDRTTAAKMELYRCLLGLVVTVAFPLPTGIPQLFLLTLYFVSSLIWLYSGIRFGLTEGVKKE